MKLYVLVDLNDDVLTSCIKFIADVLGREKFTLIDHKTLCQNNGHQNAFNSDDIKLCRLPVVINDANDQLQICYAGLCTVVRKMVHHTHTETGQEKAISLLVRETLNSFIHRPLLLDTALSSGVRIMSSFKLYNYILLSFAL